MRRPPHRDQQLAVRQHAAGVAHQGLEQRVLARAELHRHARDAHLPRGLVQRHRTGAQRPVRAARPLVLRLAAAPECRAQPRQQLAQPERLLDVVVGAVVEGGDLLRLAVARRQHDHRHRAEGAQPGQRLPAVHVRQAEIEQHGVWRARGGEAQEVGGIVRLRHRVAGRLQCGPQEAVDLRLVVDEQDQRLVHDRVHDQGGATGRSSVSTVPGSSAGISTARGLRAVMPPPIASTSPRAMARPRPVPAATRSPRRAR